MSVIKTWSNIGMNDSFVDFINMYPVIRKLSKAWRALC